MKEVMQIIRDPQMVSILGAENVAKIIMASHKNLQWHQFLQRLFALVLNVPIVWLGVYCTVYKLLPPTWVWGSFLTMSLVGLCFFFPRSALIILVPLLQKIGVKTDAMMAMEGGTETNKEDTKNVTNGN